MSGERPSFGPLDRAKAALAGGQVQTAARLAAEALSRNEADPEAWLVQSEIALRGGDLKAALAAADRAVGLSARAEARAWIQKARCHSLMDDHPAALAAATGAETAGVTRQEDFVALGALLVRCDAHEAARRNFQAALELDPDSHEAWRGLAAVLRFLGRGEEAEAACDRVLAQDPFDAEIQNLRSSLRRQTSERNHAEELSAILNSGRLDWRGAVQAAYALAKEYEDLGEWALSFRNLEFGARTRRAHTRYDAADDIRVFDAIMAAFPEPPAERGDGCPDETPIFVLGMPRTGTTLVERIISSHSRVASAGEPNDFALQMLHLIRAAPGAAGLDRLDLPRAARDLPMRDWGEAYVAALRQRAGEADRIIDKLPLNFLYAGYIHLALPNAKIVHVRRHPMDACYAMLKFLFSNAYPFSYDQRELGEYYAAHLRLMDHWRRVLPPGRLIEVDYEALVADQEAQSRRLIAELGLDWEDACLRFHENRAASTTGSASQVRERIYDASVGRWRRFEDELQPLADTLRAHGVDIG
ncbi:sulfotransferase [Phenylobacterium sp.]|uniref:tetratricopeptide repeat-containing sulfotransferase family protein n=1 Tax=Phenylobacterium sp. TaxID=1871053 RepID=UPI0035AE048D